MSGRRLGLTAVGVTVLAGWATAQAAPPSAAFPPSQAASASSAPAPSAAPTPPPASAAPAEPAAPPPAAAPAPAPSAPPAAPPPLPASAAPVGSPKAPAPQHPPDTAVVHLWASFPDAVLELRSFVDETSWKSVCRAPCDTRLRVEGFEARVSAPGMTTSNTFRIEPGTGTASFKVNGGAESTRRLGTMALVAGIPVSLLGMGLWGYGKLEDRDGFKIAGGVTLAAGGVLVLGALPLLSAGGTRVRDTRGKAIARRPPGALPPIL